MGYQVRTVWTYFNGTAYVTAIGPWTDVGAVLSFTSIGNDDGWYNVSVRAKDRAGNTGPYGNAELVLDTEEPRAVSYEPLGLAVGTGAVIVVRFSEPMSTSSVDIEVNVGGSVSWEGSQVVRYTPAMPLSYNRTYVVQVNGRDLAGNTMTTLLWQFTTIPNLGLVTGRIVDERSSPLQGAIVSLESGQTAATDSDGVFRLNAPSGTHTMTVRHDGFSDIRINVTVVAGGTLDLGETSMSEAGTDYSWVVILTFVLLVAVAIEIVYLRKKRKKLP
jgi:hypothetical protein